MASAFQFGYSNPESYSDWAKYAGLDRKTGMFSNATPEQPGVAPPENFSELVAQKVAPIQQTFSTVSNIGSQLGQGNFMGAFNTMTTKQKTPVAPQTTPSVVQPTSDYDFMHSLKNLENQ